MPPREGQRLIDKVRQFAARTGYWLLVVFVMMLLFVPVNRLDAAHEETMGIWSRLLSLNIAENAPGIQKAMDLVWERGQDQQKYVVMTSLLPWLWLLAAAVFRRRFRQFLHLKQHESPAAHDVASTV